MKKLLVLLALCIYLAMSLISCNKSDNQIRASVVMLQGERGQCSGEQIKSKSSKEYILSAGHCREITANEDVLVTTEDGRKLYRRIIAEDPHSDLLLIEAVPNLPSLSIAFDIYKNEHVRTFTHGAGMDTYLTEGFVIENQEARIPVGPGDSCPKLPKFMVGNLDTFFGSFEVCFLDLIETVTTAKIVPGSSGGPMVNDSGELNGVCSATGEYFSDMVTLKDIKRFVDNY